MLRKEIVFTTAVPPVKPHTTHYQELVVQKPRKTKDTQTYAIIGYSGWIINSKMAKSKTQNKALNEMCKFSLESATVLFQMNYGTQQNI